MLRTTLFLALFASLIAPAASSAERSSRWHRVYRVSQLLLAGGNAADVASSWGKNEANPLVRTGQRFSYGSLAIKMGTLAGSLAVQHLVVRHHPAAVPFLASGNLAASAMLGVVAAHNMHIAPAH